ncbi:hypothetical protein ACJIZ3_008297 [Penstemon smallii]|uniref:Molybdenum cofactor sulfurase n=1 Tax=Penstemon smallii TaxID=265156 RepID=A0ABD3TAA1_9LAMI
MQSNCIKETSKACFNTCCVNPLLGLPSPPKPGTTTTAADPRRDFITAILSSIQPNSNFTNHESLPTSTELLSCLNNAFPHYSNTILADNIRAHEYNHLSNHVCLDYTGTGLFSYSQLNPTAEITSSSPFFDISYKLVNLNDSYGIQDSEFEATMKRRIMRYMNLIEEDYSMIFTANQSSAFKLLADSYPFNSKQNILTVYDHENEPVQEMIKVAKHKGARPLSALFSWPNFRVNSRKLRKIVLNKNKKRNNKGLFVFPLQSRITGSRYSYQWMNLARENGWHVLLDASSLGAKDMETLGLSLFLPDFLICSFYKIFGENPSGFCCLFIKKSIFSVLSKPTTGIGIISLIPEKGPSQNSTFHEIGQNPVRLKKKEPLFTEIEELEENHEKIECRGLDHADALGLILISSRARCLINWLVNALSTLKHPHSGNGLPLVRTYGPKIKLDRGPALAFNLYDWKGFSRREGNSVGKKERL